MTKKQMADFRRRKSKILAWISAGKNYADIARILGVSRQRVQQIVNGR